MQSITRKEQGKNKEKFADVGGKKKPKKTYDF